MGRKVDAQLIKIEAKVRQIEIATEHALKAEEMIIKRHNESMIQMRDLLTMLIEGN